MTTEQQGLRFDIYERVHLSEGVAGIKELEGIELVPHIQVLPQGEQALLRGNLLLTGTYVDELDRTDQTLEHLIPVEITLPLNRVSRVEDIAVEIDNFDVDLLSARSLNITGVLSLNGLEAVPAPDEEAWRETEEEVVFVHEAGSGSPPPAAEPEPASRETSSADSNVFAGEASESVTASGEPEAVPAAASAFEPVPAENAAEEFTISTAEEKKELKLAFGSKKPEPEAAPAPEVPTVKSYGLSSLLNHAAASHARVEQQAEEEASAGSAASADKVQWKNLLLSSRGEQQEFKRLRLCIVQKEETLESIAKRYELNPREIALFNRLGDHEVSEGQIVRIPK
ncbi:LysM peptidoglycan-binding domain-containing protein [Paenibacillus filicis]|uniref:LysM peptidoglycan-binding domain-containing protein n=1 Tax=Paenibacillus gyeongsangnamensis TaxID=3388067 RepID=A0ABT4Q8Y5_9BACL|nr:LysM peptidoglycan-binding domain-containing protein [Paenibacillus filicis]MCZ8513338.1 LysM peptidoglycan-binding domain-containing protein [Paenibacillus filicis]